MKKDFDVVVIGAGINGQVMSLAASHVGFSVALIDQNSFIEDSLREFDGRAYAIAFSSVQMMKNLNLWKKIEGTAQPISNRSFQLIGTPSNDESLRPKSARFFESFACSKANLEVTVL